MTHAASASRTTSGPLRGNPLARRPTTAAWALPLCAGTAYGFWACAINREAGPWTTGNVLFGVISGILVAVISYVLHMVSPRLGPVLRSLSWTVFAGCALGFLYGQTSASIKVCALIGLAWAVGVFLVTFYRYSTSERPPDV